MGGPPTDTPQVDTSEQIYISSLALIKMLKHGERWVGIISSDTRLFRDIWEAVDVHPFQKTTKPKPTR